jgi:hypothetical protein
MDIHREPTSGPLTDIVRFLAMVGLLTIFLLGVMVGFVLAYSLQ